MHLELKSIAVSALLSLCDLDSMVLTNLRVGKSS